MIRALALALTALLLALAQEPARRLVVEDAHRAEVVAVALSEDASLAASLDAEGAVKVWALPGGQLFLSLPPLQPKPTAVTLQEGVLFVRAAGRVRGWDLHGGFEVELPKDFEPPAATRAREAAAGGLTLRASGERVEVLSADGEVTARLGGDALAPVAVDWTEAGPRALYADGSVLRWTPEGPARFQVDSPAPRDFAVTPDGAALLIGDGEGPARLVDAQNGATLHQFAGHVGHLRAVAADPAERRVVTGSSLGDVIAWDLTRQSALRVLPPHEGGVSALAWGPEGRVATGGVDGVARLVQVDTGEVLAEQGGHGGGVRALAVSPSGQRWLSGDGDGALKAWSSTGELQLSVEGKGPVGALAWLPDSETFVVAWSEALQLCDAQTGAGLARFEGPAAEVRHLVVHADGERLLAGDADGVIWAWSLRSKELLWSRRAHEAPINLLAVQDSEGRVLSGSPKGGVQRWRADTGRSDGQGPSRAVSAGALSADGQLLVLGRSAGGLGVWLPEGWVFLGRLEGDASGAAVVAASPDGELLLTGGEGGYLRSWHKSSGSMVSRVRHARPLSAVAYSRDGEWAASGDLDGGVLLWEVDRAANVRELDGVGVPVTALSFSEGGDALWIGDARGRVRRVVLAGGEPEVWATHKGPVRSLTLSPDGQRLASVGQDGLVQLWEGDAPGQGGYVGRPAQDLAWSPDGQRLLVAELERLEILAADTLAARCTLVAGAAGWQLVGADGRHAGRGEGPRVHWVEDGALLALAGEGDAAAVQACLAP